MAEKKHEISYHTFHSSSNNICLNGNKTKITTIFFDLDNTLIPTRSGDNRACRKLADYLEAHFGFTKEESTLATQTFLKSFRRCPDNTQTSLDSWRTFLWREAIPTNCGKHLAEEIYRKWLKLRYRHLSLHADYTQLLMKFRKAGYLLGLITNGPSNAQWEKIRELNIRQYFDCILVSSDLPWEKPDANIFYAACNCLNVYPSECLMIGDKLETDIKGGQLANLAGTIWVPLNANEVDNIDDIDYKPNIILKSLMDLYKYFPILNTTTGCSTSTNISNNNNLNLNNTMASGGGGGIRNSSLTSTCDSDDQKRCQQKNKSNSRFNKRSGSLPSNHCFDDSEAENSVDIF